MGQTKPYLRGPQQERYHPASNVKQQPATAWPIRTKSLRVQREIRKGEGQQEPQGESRRSS